MYGNFFKEVTQLYQLKYFSWSCLRIFFRSQSSRTVNNDYLLANFYYTARLTYAPQEWWEGVHLHTFLLWYFQHHYKVRKTPVLVTVRYKHPIKKLFTSHISVRLVYELYHYSQFLYLDSLSADKSWSFEVDESPKAEITRHIALYSLWMDNMTIFFLNFMTTFKTRKN